MTDPVFRVLRTLDEPSASFWRPGVDVLPVNTHGNQLSAGRLHGFGFLHEACLQLRGRGGDRQVPGDPEVAGETLLTKLS